MLQLNPMHCDFEQSVQLCQLLIFNVDSPGVASSGEADSPDKAEYHDPVAPRHVPSGERRTRLRNNQIWISPITKGIEGNWPSAGENYHGFWQQDPSQLNEYFGTEDDLKSLSKAVHDRGMVRQTPLPPHSNLD